MIHIPSLLVSSARLHCAISHFFTFFGIRSDNPFQTSFDVISTIFGAISSISVVSVCAFDDRQTLSIVISRYAPFGPLFVMPPPLLLRNVHAMTLINNNSNSSINIFTKRLTGLLALASGTISLFYILFCFGRIMSRCGAIFRSAPFPFCHLPSPTEPNFQRTTHLR